MRGRKDSALLGRLKKIRMRFERWRKTKKGHRRIPDPLWRAAVGLAAHYSVDQISRTLRLNHTDLSKRVEAARGARGPRGFSRPTFVEVGFPASARTADCVIELENSSGAKMRIELKGANAADIAALARGLLRGEE